MSRANGHTKKQVFRTVERAKMAQGATRGLLRSLRALQAALDFDYYGQVVWSPDETRQEIGREVLDLLSLARADYPDQQIEINVVVQVPAPDPASGTAGAETRTREERR